MSILLSTVLLMSTLQGTATTVQATEEQQKLGKYVDIAPDGTIVSIGKS